MADYKELSDGELLGLMRQDDESAFSSMYQRYWKQVLGVAAAKVDDVSEAESIVQDIFYSLWKRRNTLEVSGSFNNYLMASVKYRVIKWLDKQRRERRYQDHNELSDLLDDTTQQYLELNELTKILEELVGQLPEMPRLIYKFNKEDGKSYKEIANELGISEKSVDGHLMRTKKILRDGLGSHLSSFLL